MTQEDPEAGRPEGARPDRRRTGPAHSRRSRSRPTAWYPGRAANLVVPLGVWLAGAMVFFRAQWESGFRNLMGNSGDTALIVYLFEHWFTVLHGRTSWTSPSFYFPVKGELGLSDSFALFEVLYAPFRLLGADPFLAAQLSVVVLSLVGFLSFVALMRAVFDAPRWAALAGGLIFTFANNLWVNVGRFQLLTLWLVPLVVLLGVRAVRSRSRRRSVLLGVGCGLLGGLTMFSTYYVAWFSIPAGALVALIALVLARRRFLSGLGYWGGRGWPALIGAALGFGVAMIPFLVVYLPAHDQVTHATYEQVIQIYGARPDDLFNVGRGNLLWGAVGRSLLPGSQTTAGEADYAVTPLLMLFSLVGSVLAGVLSRRRDGRASGRAVAAMALAASALILCFMPLRYHSRSLWIILWHLPGGDAIRVVDRIELLAGALAVAGLVAAAAELWSLRSPSPDSTALRVALVAVFALAAVEQLNSGVTSGLDRPGELAFLSSVPHAPASCRSFYLTGAPANLLPVLFQIDAMLISQKIDLPTINGYGYSPRGWNLGIPNRTYLPEVRQWIALHGLSHVCALDMSAMVWTT